MDFQRRPFKIQSMLLPADYHIHTPLCRHASGEPVEYAARACAIGLEEIGFADHSPMRRDDFDDWRMRFDQLGEYVEKVRKAQRDFPMLSIKLGLEIDYLPDDVEWAKELAALHPWDYLIGSVHYISDSWAIDNPEEISKWRGRDVMEIWTTYFDRLTAMVETGIFDIVGHADLPKKFGIYPREDCAPLFERFLEAMRRKNTVLDVNTAGLRKECREIYPSPKFLKFAAEKKVPITFGSDAHKPEEVGMDFEKAVQLAKDAGYTHYCRFLRRNRALQNF